MREVAEGLVADGVAVAIAAAEQMRVVDLAVVAAGRCDYVNGASSARHRPHNSIASLTSQLF